MANVDPAAVIEGVCRTFGGKVASPELEMSTMHILH